MLKEGTLVMSARHMSADELDDARADNDLVADAREAQQWADDALRTIEALPEEDRPHIPAWLDILLTCAVTIVFVVFMRTFVVDAYEIPTGSMLETIQLGDRVLGEKLSYRFRSPRAGEVVTFKDPTDPEVTLIKRVIATEGQTVDLVGGVVCVDGIALDEPYTLGKESEPIGRHAENLAEDISYPYVVPEGCIWVMGDNRTNSLDSRYFGPVSVDSVTSHAMFIFWPFDDAATL